MTQYLLSSHLRSIHLFAAPTASWFMLSRGILGTRNVISMDQVTKVPSTVLWIEVLLAPSMKAEACLEK